MKKLLLLLNPFAGQRKANRFLPDIIRLFHDYGYRCETYITGARGDATQFLVECRERYDLIVCAGGDGTVNECISGMAETELVRPLGYIPCGSTNDFALSHEIPTDLLEAAKAIANGRQRQYDIGCFGERYFLHHALFGAFTRLAYSTDQAQKNLLGFGAYVLDGLRELPNLKPIPMIVTADGVKEEGEYLFGAVSVNGLIAGLYNLPEEIIGEKDGRLAAVLIKTPKNVADWDVLGRSLLSGDPNCAMVRVLVGERILVETPDGLEWSLDGESSGVKEKVLITAKRSFLTLQG